MTVTKHDNEKIAVPPARAQPRDAPEAAHLVDALDALALSEADDPTEAETDSLRRSVVDASSALERKQRRARPAR